MMTTPTARFAISRSGVAMRSPDQPDVPTTTLMPCATAYFDPSLRDGGKRHVHRDVGPEHLRELVFGVQLRMEGELGRRLDDLRDELAHLARRTNDGHGR